MFSSIFPGEEALAERAERHEADAEFLSVGSTSASGSRHQSEYSLWTRRDRLDGVRAADGLHACLREAEVLDLARRG